MIALFATGVAGSPIHASRSQLSDRRRKAWTQRGGCRTEVHVRDRTRAMEREQLRTALSVWNLSASDEIRSIGVTKRDLLAALRLEHLGE